MVPFNPPLIYGLDGQLHFPWFSFWRSNPLAGERLSLFITILEEVLLQDSDLEGAKFTILDFSAPSPKDSRFLTVVEAKDIPRISSSRKTEMLDVFAKGFLAAKAAVAAALPLGEKRGSDFDSNQIQLDF